MAVCVSLVLQYEFIYPSVYFSLSLAIESLYPIIQLVAGLASSSSLKPGPGMVKGLQGGLFSNRR